MFKTCLYIYIIILVIQYLLPTYNKVALFLENRLVCFVILRITTMNYVQYM